MNESTYLYLVCKMIYCHWSLIIPTCGRGSWGSIAVENIKSADVLPYPVFIIGAYHDCARRKNVQNEGSQMARKRYFPNTVFHKRAILLILQPESTESVIDLGSSATWPTMAGLGEKFSKQKFSEGWKTLIWY